MSIVDALIILMIVFGGVLGFKRGFTKELAYSVGCVGIIVLSFIFKNPLSVFLYEHLPFFNFFGIFKGVTIINILLYEVLAFLILLALFGTVLRVILLITGIFEKVLTITIILGIPSKIAGMFVGIIEFFIYVFVALFILSLPLFDIDLIKESKYKDSILNNTPILTDLSKETIKVYGEFDELLKKYEDDTSPKSFNLEALDLFLKYKVISVNSADKLYESGKLKTEGAREIINKYKGA